MKVVRQLQALQREKQPVILAAGFFDGVHRGHQQVIRRATALARRTHSRAWVLTFTPHPLKALGRETAPALLTSTPHKLRLLRSLGVKGCIVMAFTRRLARQAPDIFVARLARAIPRLHTIVIGRNWTFGRNSRGTPALLRRLARAYGFKIMVVPSVRRRGTPVSSTRIRQYIVAGQLAEAARLLGRPFSILGAVVRGRGCGRTLGVPTANLDSRNEVYPPDGVYLVRVLCGQRLTPGIANLGVRPTLTALGGTGRRRTGPRVLEVHLLGLRRRLYGRTLEVYFLKKIRGERCFPSRAALRRQIEKDRSQARRWFAQK